MLEGGGSLFSLHPNDSNDIAAPSLHV